PATLFGTNNAGLIFATSGPTATTTSITGSPNASVFGQPVTFTAAVTPTPHDTGTPTGLVTFDEEGTATLGAASLDASGVAHFTTTSPLAAGSHLINAVYGGDENFVPSTSSPLNQIIDRGAALTTLKTSVNTS